MVCRNLAEKRQRRKMERSGPDFSPPHPEKIAAIFLRLPSLQCFGDCHTAERRWFDTGRAAPGKDEEG
jgi:hypothetical protein